MELLQAATVVADDGNWMSGGQYDGPGCALRSFTSPVCSPARTPLSGSGDPDDATACGVDSFPFAVITSMRTRARYQEGDFTSWVHDAVDAEVEKAVGKFLFAGSAAIPGGDRVAWLGQADVDVVVAGANERASIAALVAEFRSIAVGVKDEDTYLHLGLEALWAVNSLIVDDDDRLEGTRIRVVTSPGYPPDAIGITGPIRIRQSSIQDLDEYNVAVNDRDIEATRFVSVEFDPCHAARVA